MKKTLLILLSVFMIPLHAHAQQPMRIVALGDSLTAGYGLPQGQDFATRLQEELVKRGLSVRVENAGVNGNTTQDGLRRLEQAIAGEKPRLVIVALGANDMLQRRDPQAARDNLAKILTTLKDRNIPAFLIGIQNPSMGPFFGGPYAKIYKSLEDEFDVPLYPFFLKGVAMDKTLNLADGIHPNEKGIAIMVQNIAPEIEDVLAD